MKRYAEWIGEALNADCVPYEERKGVCLGDYDAVIFGGGCHAGRINGVKWLARELPKLEGKRIAVFAVGAMPADAPDVSEMLRQNFTDAQWSRVRAFYMQGGLCYERMGMADRAMMAAFRAMLRRTKGADAQMIEAISRSFDCASREAIAPLTAYCRE